MGKPAHFSTKERILAAAEELFAQHGFAGTSLRQVTSQAAVNIAAVNYHFGSKENLINEVFRRRMDVMTAQRLQQLEAALRDHPGQLEPGATEQEQEPIRPPHGLRPAAPALPGPGCAGTRPAGASGP